MVMALGRAARSELAQQAGAGLGYRPGSGFVTMADELGLVAPDVWAAGSLTGATDWKESADAGRRAGAAAGGAS
jgi:hypothetical protein